MVGSSSGWLRPHIEEVLWHRIALILRGFLGTIYALCWGPQGLLFGPLRSQPLGDPGLKRPILRPAQNRSTFGKSIDNYQIRHIVSLKGYLFQAGSSQSPRVRPKFRSTFGKSIDSAQQLKAPELACLVGKMLVHPVRVVCTP